MFWSNLPLHSLAYSSFWISLPLFPSTFVWSHSLFFNPWSPLTTASTCMDIHPSTGARVVFQGPIPEENLLSFLQQPSVANRFSVRGGTSWATLSPVNAGIWTGSVLCRSCACSHSCYEFICATAPSYPETTILVEMSTTSGSYDLSAPSSVMNLEGKECDKNASFGA